MPSWIVICAMDQEGKGIPRAPEHSLYLVVALDNVFHISMNHVLTHKYLYSIFRISDNLLMDSFIFIIFIFIHSLNINSFNLITTLMKRHFSNILLLFYNV